MLIDQITAHFPKDNEEVNVHVGTRTGVTRVATGVVHVGTWTAASLHQRSMVEGMAETIMTCMMSSTAEMHVAELKPSAEIGSMMSRSSAM
jgi:hypothetical protein